ncbi:MAG: hypothetical protein WCK89_24640, partial [bacterium]
RGNLVRIIDHIPGMDLLSYVHSLPAQHEEYFQVRFLSILLHVIGSLRGIQRLHDAGLCHGDIRNDHLLIERATGQYKWIDFDLNPSVLLGSGAFWPPEGLPNAVLTGLGCML